MSKFDDELHDDVREQGEDVLDQIAASAPLSTKGNEKAAAPKDEDEGTDKNSPVYDVPKFWKRLIKSHSGAPFSVYAKMAIREKLQRDGLI